jgi:hypothetical protein
MPTPFTHLVYAQRLLSDPAVPADQRALLNAQRGAYLLGSVVADAHALAGLKREDTHFYTFEQPIVEHPWRVMMAQYPALMSVRDPAQRAFLAGYVMHLSMDEIWSLQMTGPEFAEREWATRIQRFLMLHILLIYLDERDLTVLDPRLNDALGDVQPHHWLPFLSDSVLREWDNLVYRQIIPGGGSETLEIYGIRLKRTPEELRAILNSPERMQDELWVNVSPELTMQVEANMTDHSRTQMITYLSET